MGGCCSARKKRKSLNSINSDGRSSIKPGQTIPSTLTPLRRGTVIHEAQLMNKTKNGKHINMTVLKKPMFQKDADNSGTDPSLSPDMRTIFSHPFNVCNKLTKFVYLSGIASLTKENLEKLEINLIINATYEWPKLCPIINGKEVVNIRVPVDDSGLDDISIYFDDVSDKIQENADKCGHTLVHCMAGASRSTTIVLAYLMKYQNISLANAFKSVKKRREIGRPNIGFWEQLIKYEIRIRGMASTKMIKETVDNIEVTLPDLYKKTHPELYEWEVNKQIKEGKAKLNNPGLKTKGEKEFNAETNKYE